MYTTTPSAAYGAPPPCSLVVSTTEAGGKRGIAQEAMRGPAGFPHPVTVREDTNRLYSPWHPRSESRPCHLSGVPWSIRSHGTWSAGQNYPADRGHKPVVRPGCLPSSRRPPDSGLSGILPRARCLIRTADRRNTPRQTPPERSGRPSDPSRVAKSVFPSDWPVAPSVKLLWPV